MRGGKRAGAGRKPKGYVAPTKVAGIDLEAALAAPVPEKIDQLVQGDAKASIDGLVKQLSHGASESAKVAAANEILDRGYGKPAVELGSDPMLPFMTARQSAAPIDDVRTYARRFANLAIEVLRKIRDNGDSETARVAAAKSLLARGFGTVAPARMPDHLLERALGKKEEAGIRAREAGTGRYATPPPPAALN